MESRWSHCSAGLPEVTVFSGLVRKHLGFLHQSLLFLYPQGLLSCFTFLGLQSHRMRPSPPQSLLNLYPTRTPEWLCIVMIRVVLLLIY